MRRIIRNTIIWILGSAAVLLTLKAGAQEAASEDGAPPVAGQSEGVPPTVVQTRPVVRGTIVDDQGPVAGATVNIEVSDMAIRRVVYTTRARTDLRGVYEADLSEVKASRIGIQINAVDENHAEGIKIEITPKSALPIDISLELPPGRSVSGHVYTDAGKPVPGAKVEIPYVRPVTSEYDGFYTILGAPASNYLTVRAKADGFSPETKEVESETRFGAISDVDFYLKPERRVDGRVVDPEGRPVKGANVTIYLPHQRTWRTSNEKGEFTLTDLPYEASQAQVVASHPNFAPYEKRTEIREGNTTLTIQLDTGGAVEGVVTVAPSGNPLAGAPVALSLSDALPRVLDRTDPSGRFRVENLPEGDVVLTVYPPGEDTLARSGEWLVEQTGNKIQGDVNPWPDDTASDFVGTNDNGTIRLKRRDRKSDDAPNPSARVVADYMGALAADGLSIEGTFQVVGTQRTGAWRAEREQGSAEKLGGLWMWKETLDPPKNGLAPAHKELTIVKGETQKEDVQIAEGWTLQGLVRDSQEQPVEGAQVRALLWDDHPANLRGTTSGPDGRFELSNLPKGKLAVQARREQVGLKTLTIDTPPAKSDAPLEFALSLREPGMPGQGLQQPEDLFAGSPKVGEKAPAFSATATDGSTIDLEQLQGKIVLLDFWASWCGPCIAEMPTLRRVYSRFGDRKDFAMIGISLDFNEAAMKKALDEYSIKWPQIFDGKGWETEIGTKYGVMAIPRTMLLDRKGNVLAENLRGEATLQAVEQALKGP